MFFRTFLDEKLWKASRGRALPSTNAILKLFARLHVCVCWSHLVHEHGATSRCLFVSFSKYCHDSNWEVFSLFASFAFPSGLFFFADRGVSLVHACNSLVLMFSGANASEKPPCGLQCSDSAAQCAIVHLPAFPCIHFGCGPAVSVRQSCLLQSRQFLGLRNVCVMLTAICTVWLSVARTCVG